MSSDETIAEGDLFTALAEADVLETFRQLPQVDQDRFLGWIEKARGDESRWRRIHALVVAMRTGPFHPSPVDPSHLKPAGLG